MAFLFLNESFQKPRDSWVERERRACSESEKALKKSGIYIFHIEKLFLETFKVQFIHIQHTSVYHSQMSFIWLRIEQQRALQGQNEEENLKATLFSLKAS